VCSSDLAIQLGKELSIAVVKLHNDISYLKEELNQVKREVNDLKGMKTAN
jgi:archaellum component FlaC